MSPQPPKLRRALNTPLLTLYGLGVTVGAGIYVLVGATAAEAGLYAPFAFLIAALVVAFTAASYAELSTRYPVSAGEAAYVQAGFQSRALATAVGLAVAVSGMVSAAAVAIGAASYLASFLGAPVPVLTAAVVFLMALVAGWGITQSVTVAAIITVLEIAGLLFVIGWGFGAAAPIGVTVADIVPPLTGSHWFGIALASVLAFFAFIGFEDMANVAEEVKDPVRTLPRAIFWTLGITTLLYIGTTTAVLLSVELGALGASKAPLALVFRDAPEGLQQLFGAIAVVATVNGVLIQMIMASRVLYGLADRGQLPAPLARVSRRTQTPVVATLCVAAVVLILALALPIEALAERTSQIVLTVFLLVNLSLIRLKLAHESSDRDAIEHLRLPIILPILGVVSSAGLFAVSFL
ncbi:MAG: APC family permease [Pseudomonadota bacterium]